MSDDYSKDLVLISNKSISYALSPRLCAHAALCLKHGFEERLGKPLSNALKTYLVTALTTGLTSSNLEGLPLLVDSFTKWYLEICTAYPGSDFTYRESPKKPEKYDLWLIRAGMWVDKAKVCQHIERYLKFFACADCTMYESVRQEMLNTRQSLNSPPIKAVPNDHELIVWLKDNRAALTKGNATATVISNIQQVQQAQGDTLTLVKAQCNANSTAITYVCSTSPHLTPLASVREQRNVFKSCTSASRAALSCGSES